MVVVSAIATALAAPVSAEHPRLSGPLREAHRLASEPDEELLAWRRARQGPNDAFGLSVVVETTDPASIASDAAALGGTVEVITGRAVQLWIPYESLGELADLARVQRVREPFMAKPKGLFSSEPSPTVETEGVDIVGADSWHAYGYTGKGVDVAVLDIGFANYDELLGTELPKHVRTELNDSSLVTSTHGTAVAEIIHDIAPAADLLLYQFRTDQEFVAAIEDLEGRGIEVVNASIGFDNIWPSDGTSEYSQAVDRLVASGKVWVGAAGNENDKYAIGTLSDDDDDGLVEIGGLEGVSCYAPGGQVSVSFRWTDPMTASTTDLDLVVEDQDAAECARSEEPQDGDGSAPYESIDAICSTEAPTIHVITSEPVPGGLEGFLYCAYGVEETLWSYERNLTLPGDAHSGIIVGACYADEDAAPYYSSRGPTEDGRNKPDVCAPTDVTTATYGPAAFMGTSASSPHVAGIAALLVDGLKENDPEDVATWITSEALDLGEEGTDTTFGSGAAQAGPAPYKACRTGLTSLASVLVCGAWVRRRRGAGR